MLNFLSAPVLYALELTLDCNNCCPACFNVFTRDTAARLSFEQWRHILDIITPHAHRVKLTGGEPTLFPDFPSVVQDIARRRIEFTVFTNGRWPDPDGLLDLLASVPQLTGLLISLHGAQAVSHEAFTLTPNSFDETTTNIRRATARGVRVSLSTVLTSANLNELPAIVSLANQLGARSVVFNRSLGAHLAHLALSDTELAAAVRMIEQFKTAGLPVKYGTGVPQCFTPSSSGGCLAGVAYAAIDPWGNLRPCTQSSLNCGNLLGQTLDDIWNSREMNLFRAAVPADCPTCAAFAQCHGGCKATAMALGLTADPCKRLPLAELAEVQPLRLPSNARPIARYRLRTESFGSVLMRGNVIVPVKPEATEVLEDLDGSHTLSDIQRIFGATGLSLVGALYQKGLVELLT